MERNRPRRAGKLPPSDLEAVAPNPQPAITVSNLVKFFGRFAALRGTSYDFFAGNLYVILGDNGAGKSTLLRIIAGLMQPSQGSVKVLGSTALRPVAQRVGYMGPCPPPGLPHHYTLEVYALDSKLDIPATGGRDDLQKALGGHILASGVYNGLFHR